MSNVGLLLDSVRSGYAKMAEIEAVLSAYPADRSVRASFQSIKRHVEALEAEWLEECRTSQVEVCRYRLVASTGGGYSASSFAKSLLEFQGLFAQIFDAKKRGAKSRARIAPDVAAETLFEFAYTYPGSLGVVLTVDDAPNLFGGQFDAAIDAFNEITAIDSVATVKSTAKSLGNAVIKRVFDWSTVNHSAGFSVDVTWAGGFQSYLKGKVVNYSDLARNIQIISQTSDTAKSRIRVFGTLVAIDTVQRRFRLVVPDGEDIKGVLSSSFDANERWTVNLMYHAEIDVETTTRYAVEKIEQTYRLESLSK